MNLVLVTFLVLQVLLFFVFKWSDFGKENFAISGLFRTRFQFLVFNLSVVVVCLVVNNQWQLFCKPVTWAAVILFFWLGSFLFLPFTAIRSLSGFSSAMLSGFGLFLCFYLIDFGGFDYAVLVVVNLPILALLHFYVWGFKRVSDKRYSHALYFYPAIICAPYFVLWQIWRFYKRYTKAQKRLFLATPVALCIILTVLSFRIQTIVTEIEVVSKEGNDVSVLIDNPIDKYLTELVLGAHWKYHTRLCLYDGWRPPYHDPVLVFAARIQSGCRLSAFKRECHFSQGANLPTAYGLYRVTFPENDVSFKRKCRCAKKQNIFD